MFLFISLFTFLYFNLSCFQNQPPQLQVIYACVCSLHDTIIQTVLSFLMTFYYILVSMSCRPLYLYFGYFSFQAQTGFSVCTYVCSARNAWPLFGIGYLHDTCLFCCLLYAYKCTYCLMFLHDSTMYVYARTTAWCYIAILYVLARSTM